MAKPFSKKRLAKETRSDGQMIPQTVRLDRLGEVIPDMARGEGIMQGRPEIEDR